MKFLVPFYSQHWDLDDWQNLGYKSRKDAHYWQESCCGILCMKMVLDSFRAQKNQSLLPSVKALIDQGVERGAYQDATGWSHVGLVSFIESFDYPARACKLKVKDIKKALDNNQLIIVSIKWGFRSDKGLKEKILFWKKYGGHLAVVIGYEEENDKILGFYVHHTSKVEELEQADEFISISKFLKGFTGRGIVVG